MGGALSRLVEWIGSGDGVRGPWVRLGVVIAAIFALSLIRGMAKGRLQGDWWLSPLFYAFFLLVPFCLWRLIERRRRAARARDKAVRHLDLG
jgi:hypothetical protein